MLKHHHSTFSTILVGNRQRQRKEYNGAWIELLQLHVGFAYLLSTCLFQV